MQRLQISSRPSEEFLINLSLDSSSTDGLVVYDIAKKEMMLHNNSYNSGNGERAIHIIPLVLFLCAFVLWAFSSAPTITTSTNNMQT
ncbi:uncharacterized protein LOC108839099 [Raphanus sativus]|uniref:Uncharacterized protein LOC108839099 n=1 Tax=Raphanus sativus TaxID=3726 RepID=A0A6J0M653_RAPSA|nr:uncharacterized protein LOC108839099 [Raphanus sativus]